MAEHEQEDRDELISRLLDGELDDVSRHRLEQDPAAARAVNRARRVQQELQALPEATEDPGPRLTDRIMRSLPAAPDGVRPRHTSALAWLRRPVAVPAWGLALAAGLVLVLGAWLALRGPAPAAAPEPAPSPAVAAAPECPRDLLVRFVLRAPGAQRVSVAGDFNHWSMQATPLSDSDGNGIWTAVVPLRPGRYQYKFVIDGKQWIVDPDAPAYHPDGFGGRNALLAI